MFQRAGKDIKRLRQIVGILVKYGYGELVQGIPDITPEIFRPSLTPPAPPGPAPQRFRLMLEELGTTFIKLGQVLSVRPDLVSRPYIEELKKLQDSCEAIPFEAIKDAVETGLGGDTKQFFSHIDESPIATASMAQVHRATTREGDAVVIKVRRPGLEDQIRSDVEILYRIARILDRVIEESAVAEPVGVVREFDAAVTAELNFENEARNVRRFGDMRKNTADIAIPKVYPHHSSTTVLTLEFLKGRPFSNIPADHDLEALAGRILQEALEEVFVDGFFHADPHPGNLLLLDDGRYAILDFGLCGALTPKMRDTLVVLSIAIAVRDADSAARTLYRLGQSDSRISMADLRADIDGLFDRYLGRAIQDVDSSALINDLLLLAVRHQIRVPPEYTMLSRAAATIEGIVRDFAPGLDVTQVAAPYLERLLIDRVKPEDLENNLYKWMLQFQGLSEDVPIQLSQILADLSQGKLNVTIGGAQFERLREAIVLAAAAVCGSILGAALLIGSFIVLGSQDLGVVTVLSGAAGVGVFFWVAAYMLLRPRLRKVSLSQLISKSRKP